MIQPRSASGLSVAEPTDDGLRGKAFVLAMAVVCCGPLLSSVDASIANVVLPVLAVQFKATPSATVWIATAYQLAAIVCLLPFAALGARLGCRRVYLWGLTLFAAASLGCALSPSLPILIAFRVLQGIGGAATGGVSMALVRFIYPQARLGRGVALYGLVASAGLTAGPTIAAAILSIATWPWLFLVNLPVIALAITNASLVPDSPRRPAPFDLTGTVVNGLALVLLVLGVGALAGKNLWVSAAMLSATLALVILLFRHQSTRADALLPIDLLRGPQFSLSAGASICAYSAQTGAMVAMPFLVHDVMARPPATTGLLMTPWPLLIMLMAPITGRLSDRVPVGIMSSAGLLIMALGLLTLMTLEAGSADVDVLWRMALCGLGFGLFQAPNNRSLIASAPLHRSSSANGVSALSRMLGQTLGSAGTAVCFGWFGRMGASPALWLAVGWAALGLAVGGARLLTWQEPGDSPRA